MKQVVAGVALLLCAMVAGPVCAGPVVGKPGDVECAFTVYADAAAQPEYQLLDIRVRPRRLEVPQPKGMEPLAPCYLDIYRGDTWLTTVRVFPGGSVSALPFAGRPWYRVDSHCTDTGAGDMRLSLISPQGEVINVYDADFVSGEQVEQKDGSLHFSWQSKYANADAAGGAVSYMDSQGMAVVGPQRVRTEERLPGDDPNILDWRKLRTVRATYLASEEVDNTLTLLRFRTEQGEKLEVLDFGWYWRWLEATKGRALLLTVGACDYENTMESGQLDAALYDVVPLPGN